MYPAGRWFDFIKAAVIAHSPSLELIVSIATQGDAELRAEQIERSKASARRLAEMARAEASDE